MTFVDEGCQVTFISTTAQCSRGQSCRAWKNIFDDYSLPLSIYVSLINLSGWHVKLGWLNNYSSYECLSTLDFPTQSTMPMTQAGVSNVNECLIVSWLGEGGLHFCEVISTLLNFSPEFLEGEGAARDLRYFRAWESIKWRLILGETFDVWFE